MPTRPARVGIAQRAVRHTVYPPVFPTFEPRAADETLSLIRLVLSLVANTFVRIINDEDR